MFDRNNCGAYYRVQTTSQIIKVVHPPTRKQLLDAKSHHPTVIDLCDESDEELGDVVAPPNRTNEKNANNKRKRKEGGRGSGSRLTAGKTQRTREATAPRPDGVSPKQKRCRNCKHLGFVDNTAYNHNTSTCPRGKASFDTIVQEEEQPAEEEEKEEEEQQQQHQVEQLEEDDDDNMLVGGFIPMKKKIEERKKEQAALEKTWRNKARKEKKDHLKTRWCFQNCYCRKCDAPRWKGELPGYQLMSPRMRHMTRCVCDTIKGCGRWPGETSDEEEEWPSSSEESEDEEPEQEEQQQQQQQQEQEQEQEHHQQQQQIEQDFLTL